VTSPSTPSVPFPRRARLRVLAFAFVAAVAGLGPAVAWDMTTQPPRAEPRSPWPKVSPWKTAGAHMKDSAKAMARVYLPAGPAEPDETATPTGTAAAPSALAVTTPPPPITLVRPAPIPRMAIAVE